MKIVIINGNDSLKSFDNYLARVHKELTSMGNTVETLKLAKLNLKQCIGCWSCWGKTPGECALKDDSEKVNRAIINSDLVVFASPLKMGFISALLKRSLDRAIPLIHPFMSLREGELHHTPRYEKYPLICALMAKEKISDEQDLELVERYFHRLKKNFFSEFKLLLTTDTNVAEAADAINNL